MNTRVDSKEQIRSFIAIELSAGLKRYLGDVQEKLKSAGCSSVKWVAVDSIHLTLKFLGNIPEKNVPQIADAIGRACLGQSPFRLTTANLGVFPGIKRPRVLWIAVNGEVERLVKLQQRMDIQLEPLGYEKEKRPFSPHITLARTRDRIRPDEQALLGKLTQETVLNGSAGVDVCEISLMKSRLMPGGAIYTKITATQLTGNQT